MARTLLDKVWEAHTVRTLPSGQTQLLIGLHLIHEVTTPQAFQMLKDAEAEGAHARADLRHARPHHPDDGSDPPLRRPDGGGDGRAHVPQHEGVRPAALRHVDAASRASST